MFIVKILAYQTSNVFHLPRSNIYIVYNAILDRYLITITKTEKRIPKC